MRIIAALLSLGLAACSPQPSVKMGTMPDLDGSFDFAELEIINDAGDSLRFDIYLAESPEQQRRGLMFVRSMPDTTGMLFVYEADDFHSMWMKNTFIPLDMIFARSDGSVSSVISNTTPLTLNSNQSREPVSYVLELNAGIARRMGIGQASRLIWD
ncbi:MAG: DUF192 domain-containing protein [Gammaproteobacteria bacterium]|nr:DUF192 domain-containing protein [Gammaproteobacteria bacterium]